MNKKRMKQYNLRMPEQLINQMEEIAASLGISTSLAARIAFRDFVNKYRLDGESYEQIELKQN